MQQNPLHPMPCRALQPHGRPSYGDVRAAWGHNALLGGFGNSERPVNRLATGRRAAAGGPVFKLEGYYVGRSPP
jgi:hypothetical protein